MQPQFCIPSPDLAITRAYFERLQFVVQAADQALWVGVGTWQFYVEAKANVRAGWRFYTDDAAREMERLQAYCSFKPSGNEWLGTDGNGIWIRLSEEEFPQPPIRQTEGKNLCGRFVGISQEVADLSKASELYQQLGFAVQAGSAESGWVSLLHANGTALSLMPYGVCPHLFFNPSLTFFNGGGNLPIIEQLRLAGVPIAQEITHFNQEGLVDNVILCDPSGLGIFVFND